MKLSTYYIDGLNVCRQIDVFAYSQLYRYFKVSGPTISAHMVGPGHSVYSSQT